MVSRTGRDAELGLDETPAAEGLHHIPCPIHHVLGGFWHRENERIVWKNRWSNDVGSQQSGVPGATRRQSLTADDDALPPGDDT